VRSFNATILMPRLAAVDALRCRDYKRRAGGEPLAAVRFFSTSGRTTRSGQTGRPHTEINQSRRSEMRSFMRKVEEAIASGDRGRALAALQEAEPVIMRSAQKGVLHSNTASRKVSRLAHRVAKLGS